MKRKIAVLANGWNNLSIAQAIKGIRTVTDKLNFDVFLFLSFAAFAQTDERNRGEDAIFDLTDYKDFDGVIMFSGMLNSADTPQRLAKVFLKNNIPAISVGMKVDGLDYVGIDNFQGMYEMVSHLVEHHGVKNPVFLAGPASHPDSNERLEATKLALMDHGVELKSENIVYTDWEYLTSQIHALRYSQLPNPPDAFICANDHNAIAACVALQRHGFKIPGDFIVTGFDKISYAESFYPSITTVWQDYEKIGYIAAWQLMEKLEGNAVTNSITVSSDFEKNESCGCKPEQFAEPARHQFCIDAYAKEMESFVFHSHTTEMGKAIFECTTFDDFKKNLNTFYLGNHEYEGSEFYFILDTNTENAFKDDKFPLKKSYSDVMTCLFGMREDKRIELNNEEFSRTELFPGYVKRSNPVVYTFTSLHYDDNLFGYFVMTDSMEHIKDSTLNRYMTQMNYNIEQYRQNCKLDEMNRTLRNVSIKDQLTGLYNRFGMEQIGFPLLDKSKAENKPCAIAFADINRMKHINDNFGHLHGDLAIRSVSSALQEELPEGWIGIRYGGDEFIAVGICEDEQFVEDYINRLNENLKAHVASMQLAYPLTISCGYILSDPKSDLGLVDYINQADSIMYVHKQKTYEDEKSKSVATNIKSLDELPRVGL